MAYLRIETRDGVQRVPLDHDRLRIGRLSSNDVILPYRQISREHAEVERAGSEWWISDLDSTNGLQVGGRQVDRYPLRPGERVYLAPDIVVSLAADDDDFAALATTQMGVAGADMSGGMPDGAAGGVPPLLLHLGPDGAGVPFSLPARPVSDPDLAGSRARSQRGARGTRLDEGDLERSAEAWRTSSASGAANSGASWPVRGSRSRMDDDPEGDLFRRRARPSSRGARERHADRAAAGTVMLHVCLTCGQLTPADGITCQFCHNPLAVPCARCGMSLLPVHDFCPRCQTANPGAARRRTPSG